MSKLPSNLFSTFSLDRHFLLVIISFLTLGSIVAQSKDPFQLDELKRTEVIANKNLFSSEISEKNSIRTEGVRYFRTNSKIIKSIKNAFYPLIATNIPIQKDINQEFLFTEYDFFTPDFEVNLLQEGTSQSIMVDKGIHLKGKLDGDLNSFSSLSLFDGEIYGTAYTGDGHRVNITPYETGNLENLKCIISDENKISPYQFSSGCNTDDILQFMGSENEIQIRTSDNCKSLNVSVDIDYDLYLKFKGNVQSITNYVTSLFNNVHTLYKRENISIALAQINIHSTKDNFSHISASEDLENFRKKYPNYKKTLKLILSGYSKLNQATLGGIAYINTICLSSYSYGFANVTGTYLNAPVYSWDVFLVTHELGHIMGSKHTHACAWGPKKNQAIDNCAKLEGSCAPPGVPAKGTMMSYCYLTGMPGIDFTLGFGKEPGDLIRQKVKSSSCLASYIPITKTLDKANTIIEANLECTDGSYTHYYFDNNSIDPVDDILLLSLAKNGNDIGEIGDGTFSIKLITTKNYGTKKANQITASYVERTKPWFVSNKYWEIKTTKKPAKAIDIKYYYNTKDLEDLKGSVGTIIPSDIKLFNLLPPANPNPESNHANATTQQFISYSSSLKKVLNTYILTSPESNLYSLEVNTLTFANTGIGISINTSQAFVGFVNLNIAYQNNQANIDFKTSKEINCGYFVIEKSTDQIQFDSIGKINAKGNSVNPLNYKYNSSIKDTLETFYRIKAFSTKREVFFSPIFSKGNTYSATNELTLYPSPVKSGVLFVDYINKSGALDAEIAVLDIYGRTLKSSKQILNSGTNYFNINTYDFKNGIHYLRITCKSDVQKIGFTINQ